MSRKPLRIVAAVSIVGFAACSDMVSDAPTSPEGPLTDGVLRTSADSIQAFESAQQLLSSSADSGIVTLVLEESAGFEVTLYDRDCAWPTNRLDLLAPVEENLTNTACQEPIG